MGVVMVKRILTLIFIGTALVVPLSYEAYNTSDAASDDITITTSFGSDKYEFERSYYSADKAYVEIHRYSNSEEMLEAVQVYNPEFVPTEGRILKGYAFFSYEDGTALCSIHILDPRVSYEPEFIGHEFVHCIHGKFHK